MSESDINVTTPPGSQTSTLQQQMSPSCHPIVSQSSEGFLQPTAHNHELATITPKQDKKRKTHKFYDMTNLFLLKFYSSFRAT